MLKFILSQARQTANIETMLIRETILCTAMLLVLTVAGGAAPAEAARRPNILWIVVEDLSPWMPMFGDRTVPTPHLAALAKDGVVFTKCFASAPVCSPSRSALITGSWQTRLGIHQHRSSRTPQTALQLPDHVRTLPEIMREAGYFTYNHGKDDYNFAFERDKLYFSEKEPRDFGFYGVHGYGHWSFRKPGQAFFGQFMLDGGKLKRKPAAPLDPSEVPVPPYYPDTPGFRQAIAAHYDDVRLTDDEVGEVIAQLKRDRLYEDTIIIFFSDHGCDLPRHKSLLYDASLQVPLIVAWPGNPEALGGANTVRTDLVSLIDVTAATLELAGLETPEWMDARNPFATGFQRDVLPFARDRIDWTPDRLRGVRTNRYKFIRNYKTDRPALATNDYRAKQPVQRELRELEAAGKLTEAQRFILRIDRPAEELYDLQRDPHELKNLAADPASTAVLQEMRAILDRWIADTGDQGRHPESELQFQVLLKRWGKRCILPEFEPHR